MNLSCPLCESDRILKIYGHVRHSENSSIEKCAECGLIFQYPFMPPEQEREFYEKQFPEYMKRRGAAAETDPAAHFAANKKEARRRLEYIAPYLKKTDSVLELGSSTGFFIDEIKGLAAGVCGVEPGELYADYANGRGLKTYCSLDEIANKKFDVIFSFYVFEHLRNPVEFLNKLKNNVNKCGMVIFEVPNVDDILVSFYGGPELFDFYWQLAHYFYYSAATLRRIFEKCGYTVDTVRYSQRYDISNHIHWLKEHRPGGLGKHIDIFDERLNQEYKRNLIEKGMSDTITVFAKI